MSAVTAASDDEMHAEIERLRAENAELNQQLAQRVPDGYVVVKEEPHRETLIVLQQLLHGDSGTVSTRAAVQLWEMALDRQTRYAAAPAMLPQHSGFSQAPAQPVAQPEQPAPPVGNHAPFPWPLETDKPAAQPCGERGYCGRMPFCDCGNDAGLPERDTGKPAEQQGVFRKFEVRRVDGSDKPGDKHHGCEYFVLDVNHDPCAGAALAAYATAVEATHPVLAADMRSRYQLQPAAQDCSAVGDGPNPYYAGNFTGESDELANLRRRLVAERDAALKQPAAQSERSESACSHRRRK